jgi:hypothetical protein
MSWKGINYDGLTYIALRRLKVGSTYREKGDAVPEAAHWRNLDNYISSGQIAVVGGPQAHPGTRAKQPGKAQGGVVFPQPADHTGRVAKPPVDTS